MRTRITLLLAATLFASMLIAEPAKLTPYAYKAGDGTNVDAERGEFRVPENRTRPDSRKITLRFIRFKSTSKTPGFPIVYLAGGPGGSGIESARYSRFPLFMALREFGDVIAFDQRGINESEPDMRCTETFAAPFDAPLDRKTTGAALAAAARKCAERLRAAGVDVAAYNTRESAADLNDLRQALGAQKLILWGISYGTHLSIATLRWHPEAIDRVILAGIEGPDDTYKLPQDQQLLMEDIARIAHQQGKSADLIASVQRLMLELEARPKQVSITDPVSGATTNLVLGKLDLQRAIADMLFAPSFFAGVPALVSSLEQGDWVSLAMLVAGERSGSAPSMMSIAMDCASGISAGRRQRIAEEAKFTLLGDAINFPFPEICEGLNVPDLGEAFRAPLVSDVPALLISGTLDGRTRPRQAEELRRFLPNAQHLILEYAGHSDPLFLSSPKILDAMKAFLRKEPLRERVITLPPITFDEPHKLVTLGDEVLTRYAGAYRLGDILVKMVKAGSLLYVMVPDEPPYAIRPISETEFLAPTLGGLMRFEIEQERVVAVTLVRAGQPDQRVVRVPVD